MAGDRRAADTVGLLTLVGTQLGQAMAIRRSDAITLLSGTGAFAALLAIVQTPGISRGFGCRPLGPLGLLQAGAITAFGTGVGWLINRGGSLRPPAPAGPGSRHAPEAYPAAARPSPQDSAHRA